MKVLIVEDEAHAAEKLVGILNQLDAEIEVLDICHSVSNTIAWIKNNPSPDLIFMDIQLTDGLSLEVFKKVDISCPTIFITAFDKFAIQAFKVNSIDYILKPYSSDDVKQALEQHQRLQVDNERHTALYRQMAQKLTSNYKTRFFAKLNNNVYSIETTDVQYLKFEDKSTILVDHNNRKFVIDYSLDALTEILDPLSFFRINRQYIISFNSIEKMEISAKNRIEIKLFGVSKKEHVSRAKTNDFKIWLDQ